MSSRINVPLGYRFIPTEEELISEYLRRKVKREFLPCEGFIIERDIYEKAPWDVFNVEDPWYSSKIKDKKWEHVIYVFTKLKKIGGKKRIIRKAGCGTWNGQTGIEKIYNEKKEHIGFKKMLVFEVDVRKDDMMIMPPGHWIMHEYSLGGVSLDGGLKDDYDYVVCKIKRDDSKSLKRAPSGHAGGAIHGDLGYTDAAAAAAGDYSSKTISQCSSVTMDEQLLSKTSHGGAIDHDHGYLSKTGHAISKEENPTHKKMRYDVSTPENSDQPVTLIGHQLLQAQQSEFSSPSDRLFDATTTLDQQLPPHETRLLDLPNITMNSTYTIENPIDQSFFDNIDLEINRIINGEH